MEIVENIKIFHSYRKSDADDAKTFSGPFTPLSTVPAIPACMSPFTRGQGAVIRRIGDRGHFRSRDKDGGQSIPSAMPEKKPCYTQTARLYLYVEPKLLRIAVLHCGKTECRFSRKYSRKY